jgi:diguanylate cyclase (GGDEF)-like protein/PAS domain S-box-containing protein
MERPRLREMIRSARGFAVSAALIAALVLLRLALTRRFGLQLPAFIFFYPAVMFTALLYGQSVGLWATALASLAASVWLFPPIGRFEISAPSDLISLVFFASMGVCMSVVFDNSRKNQRKVAALEGEQLLRGSKAKLQTALENMADAVFISDTNGALIDFNSAFATFHKFRTKQDCANHHNDYQEILEISTLNNDLLPLDMWAVPRALRGESAINAEYKVRRKDTGDSWIGSYNFSPLLDELGNITGSVVVARDISEHKRTEESLRASEMRYRTAFQTSHDAMAINTVADGRYLDINQTFVEMSGYEHDEVIGRTSLELGLWADPHDREKLVKILRHGPCPYHQARFRRKSGEIFWGVMSASLIELDGRKCLLSVTRDISQAKCAEEEIRSLAFFDPLTGLANRRFLTEQLRKSTALSVRTQLKRALLLIDLDNFKILNDTLGHPTGDLLLQEVAKRLLSCVRDSDTMSRFGGDEFVALVEELSNTSEEAAAHALAIGEKIMAKIDQPYLLDGHEWVITCSIGISIFGNEHDHASEVLQQAELALYQAKAAGRNSIRFFEPALQAAVNARAALEESLRTGIKGGQFVIFYQGQFDRGRLIGAEALLRWKHPDLGMLSPLNFIPLAEETRLIVPLGNWVLETVCVQIAAWAKDEQTAHLKVAVNISVEQLRRPDFVEEVLTIFARTGASPHNLRLELTESMLVTNIEDAITKMTALKAHGVGFSLDDFGTGYSSLAYLRRLPIDQLKIDRSFVNDMLVDATSGVIAQTIIALSKAMALPVIAEGIETAEQVAFLENLGCYCFQGFLFSRPLPLYEFERLLPGFMREPAPFAAAS